MTPNIDPALVERMVQLVRDMTSPGCTASSAWTEARAIVAELPDPDLEAARIVASRWAAGTPFPFVGHLSCGSAALEELALAGIKHGRETAR